MNKLFVFVVAIIACINAAPVEQEIPSIAPEPDSVKAAIEPAERDVRAFVDNAEFAVKDLTDLAAKSANELAEKAKEIINPSNIEDRGLVRSNIANQVKSLLTESKALGKQLMTKALEDYEPVEASGKSALFSAGNAAKMLESKYLTEDGKALVRTLAGVAKTKAIHAEEDK